MPVVQQPVKPNRAPWVVAGLCVVMAAGIAGAVLLFKAMPKEQSLTTQQAIAKANDAMFSENYALALELLEQQLPKAKTTDDKVRLYTNIGSVYVNQGNYPKALGAFQSARSLKETYGTIKSVADAAKRAGDKPLAMASYKLLEQRITNGTYKQQYMDLEEIRTKIKDLEAAE